MSEEPYGSRIPASRLLPGFAMIVLSWIGVIVAMAVAMVGGSQLFFPDSWEMLSSGRLTREQAIDSAETLVPAGLFWIVAAAGSLTSLVAGYFVFRLSRGSPANLVFLAVLLFVSALQISSTSAETVRWMPLILMGLLPTSTVVGAAAAWYSLAGGFARENGKS